MCLLHELLTHNRAYALLWIILDRLNRNFGQRGSALNRIAFTMELQWETVILHSKILHVSVVEMLFKGSQ